MVEHTREGDLMSVIPAPHTRDKLRPESSLLFTFPPVFLT
ncbi:hypothetical protein ASZ90_007390 [hydrocarbon metagenome]|uniref:Uncharacterized protein n=1 Tax=hydrocarbon metagenome TaxID=938273 RepID=A0A0W8FPH6_9ZZZZ